MTWNSFSQSKFNINFGYPSFSSLDYSERSFPRGFLALFHELLLSLGLVIKLVSSWQTGIYSLLHTWSVSMAPLKNNQRTCRSHSSPRRESPQASQDSVDMSCFRRPRFSTLILHTHQCALTRQTYQIKLTIMLITPNYKSSTENWWYPKAFMNVNKWQLVHIF